MTASQVTAELANGRQVLLLVVAIALSVGTGPSFAMLRAWGSSARRSDSSSR